MQAQFSGSAYQARAILGAWQSRDKNRLDQELERVGTASEADAGEQERLELLAEIAGELRTTDQPFGDEVYGSLLAHLAFTGRRAGKSGRVNGSWMN
ncbi:MAG: hypothetical protein JO061_16380 [Acidobacteriaceae bacterium]|nr:hypothetical protein [Acidobacteriaceae bacterium]